MELSRSIKESAVSTIESPSEDLPESLIPLEGTPFFLSLNGHGIIVHGKVTRDNQDFYVGTREEKTE